MSPEEYANPVTASEEGMEIEFALDDCRTAFLGIVHEEKLLEKKRRWLMASLVTCRSTQKKLRMSNFFRNVYLPESFVRSDDVDLQDIRMLVQKGFRLSAETKGLERTHPEMKGIIEESSPESLAQSQSGNHFESVNVLSQILSQLTSLTPISSSLDSSIRKILEGLEGLPSLALIAMNRKLKDLAVTPKFPVVFSCKRNILIDRLRKKCHKILTKLGEGGQLPKSLAKALSVMLLAVKQITRQADIVTTKIFPCTSEVEKMQNEILKAIWSLPNVKHGELKHLQCVIAPNSNLPSKSLRRSLHNYLMEYLFQCDEVHVPKPFLMALNLINKGSGCQLLDEEVEAILNISSQLRQLVWNSFPDESMDQDFANAFAEGLEANGNNCDITIDEHEDCSTFGYSDYLQICGPDDEAEGTGDSMQVASCLSFNSEDRISQLIEGKCVTSNSKDEPRSNQIGPSAELSCQLKYKNMNNRYVALKNVCDETSLAAYKLVGHLLEEVVQNEGKRVDEATKLYLRGGGSSTPNCQDPGKASVLSENSDSAIFQGLV